MGIEGLLNLLLHLAIGALVVWFVFWLIGYIGLPETPRRIIVVVIAIIVVVWLIRTLLPGIL